MATAFGKKHLGALGSVIVFLGTIALGQACSATSTRNGFTGGGGDDTSGVGGDSTNANTSAVATSGIGGFNLSGSGGNSDAGPVVLGDPTTCAEAAMYKTYIGCDFWPTVVANNVWSIFDYAVVVANAGMTTADVKVERNGGVIQTAQIAPNSLATIYLPWVPELKGMDSSSCGNPFPLTSSVRSNGGAYHLTSTVPVTTYQFNAIEYKPEGGPPGKDWSQCPAKDCFGAMLPCFSYTNDASLLLPSTAMTGNYRITGEAGWPFGELGDYFAITGTQDNTSVTVYVSSDGNILAGEGITAVGKNQKITLSINAGDVLELTGDPGSDLTGSLVKASAPVQVISGVPCIYIPGDHSACDHIEESVLPAETLGKHYFVTVPTSPHATLYGHEVRIVGNIDGTALSYPSGAPPLGAPTTINAGQVVDLGAVTTDFEISGDHEFAVSMFLLAATLVDPLADVMNLEGDPSQTQAVAVEQYRKKYVFLAPSDYTENYVDIVQPMGATVTVDGVAVGVPVTAIGSGFGVARLTLGQGQNGAHVLTSDVPVGIQVVGYGNYTSYEYPGGLNLDIIAPPPPPPK